MQVAVIEEDLQFIAQILQEQLACRNSIWRIFPGKVCCQK